MDDNLLMPNLVDSSVLPFLNFHVAFNLLLKLSSPVASTVLLSPTSQNTVYPRNTGVVSVILALVPSG